MTESGPQEEPRLVVKTDDQELKQRGRLTALFLILGGLALVAAIVLFIIFFQNEKIKEVPATSVPVPTVTVPGGAPVVPGQPGGSGGPGGGGPEGPPGQEGPPGSVIVIPGSSPSNGSGDNPPQPTSPPPTSPPPTQPPQPPPTEPPLVCVRGICLR